MKTPSWQAMAKLCALLVACGLVLWINSRQTGPRGLHAVSGTVTVDGRPLDRGAVSFSRRDGDAFDAMAYVNDGRFGLPRKHGLARGTYRVSVTALPADSSRSPEANLGEQTAHKAYQLPSKFNSKSELTVEIDGRGDKTIALDLSSQSVPSPHAFAPPRARSSPEPTQPQPRGASR